MSTIEEYKDFIRYLYNKGITKNIDVLRAIAKYTIYRKNNNPFKKSMKSLYNYFIQGADDKLKEHIESFWEQKQLHFEKDLDKYDISFVFGPEELFSYKKQQIMDSDSDIEQSRFIAEDAVRDFAEIPRPKYVKKERVPIKMKLQPDEFNQENTILPDEIEKFKKIRKTKPARINIGKRKDKDIDDIYERIKDIGPEDITTKNEHQLTYYKKNFLDTIINGNFRVKYIPNAATRDLATEYCHTHLDENNMPKYRLLPPNSKDPVGVPITDLNGDKVDDIVLVDKRGLPAIVNGYKLVRADPYKKIWQNQENTREKRLLKPFNVWLNQQFNKSIDNVDWNKGEYNIKPNANMEKYMAAYTDVGLPKPSVRSKLTPSSYWASMYSKIWGIFWASFPPENGFRSSILRLKAVTRYLPICNAVFIALFDAPACKEYSKVFYEGKLIPYKTWNTIRKTEKKWYNEYVGGRLQLFYDKGIKEMFDDNGNFRREYIGKFTKLSNSALFHTEQLIFNGLGMPYNYKDQEWRDAILRFAYAAYDDPTFAEESRQNFEENLAALIEDHHYGRGSGYAEYITKQKQKKEKRKKQAMNFDIKPTVGGMPEETEAHSFNLSDDGEPQG